MKLQHCVHPSELLYEMLLDAPHTLLKTYPELFKNIVLNKKNLTEEDCKYLSIAFQTSKQYWMNLQKQWDDVQSLLGEDTACSDMAKEIIMPLSAINYTLKTSTPTRTYLNEDKDIPVYVLTEQAYKYMLSKCTEDELWDLGWLGQSEEHASSAIIPESFKQALGNLKSKTFSFDTNPGSFLSNDYSNGLLDLLAMNANPRKYATHCMIADESRLVIEATPTCPQLLFIEGSWQPSSIYSGILKQL